MKIMKVVFDTNILISAAIAKGKPRKLLIKALVSEFILISSNELLEELQGVIARPKFRFSSPEVHKFMKTVRQTAKIVNVKSDFRVIKEDPDDDKVLNVAYDGRADYIVTGDRHLLKLKTFKGIKIVTANRFSKLFKD